MNSPSTSSRGSRHVYYNGQCDSPSEVTGPDLEQAHDNGSAKTSPTLSTSPESRSGKGSRSSKKIDKVRSDLNRRFDENEEARRTIEREEEENNKKGGCKGNRFLICTLVSIVSISALVLAIVLMKYNENTDAPRGDPAPFAPIAPVSPTPPVAPVAPTPTTSAPVAPPAPSVPTAPSVPPPTGTASPIASPTLAPVDVPTTSPTVDFRAPLADVLVDHNIVVDVQDETSPSARAYEWMVEEASDSGSHFHEDPEKVVQRFSLLAMDYSLQQEPDDVFVTPSVNRDNNRALDEVTISANMLTNWGMRNQDECQWYGVTCVDGYVTELHYAGLDLKGELPTEIGLLANLTYIDMSKNNIRGSLPEEIYDLANLEKLFLYMNQLTGSIGAGAGNWWKLNHLHLSHNQLTGSIPSELKSGQTIRPLQYVNLYTNKLSGSIPSSLRWRQLFYLDLGRNQMTGYLPEDLGEKFIDLRHLHLDHNKFRGPLPLSYINVGNGRVESLLINDNQLTGEVPDERRLEDKLVQFTVQNNDFSGLGKDTCKISVFEGGESVEFKADCDICNCKDEIFCSDC